MLNSFSNISIFISICCDGVGVTTGHGNWDGCKWRSFWCFLVPQECHRDAWDASWECCGDAVVMPMLLGAKQGQDVYLAGQLLPSSLDTPIRTVNFATTHLVDMLSLCHDLMSVNVELIVVSY